jgi:hypothetical protein
LTWSRFGYRFAYIAAMAGLMAALYLVRVYAGDPNPDAHGIIRILLPM